ncbi:MAG TPA: helix-turn-helix domain-containing protein [Nitrososphaera sp.]|jgi:DNA-binding HxlR family transcriptional regulator|nr:helix-turn-helix domain-containing protein [Nitrososphaera sp.]
MHRRQGIVALVQGQFAARKRGAAGMNVTLDRMNSSGRRGFVGATRIAKTLGRRWALLILENLSAGEPASFGDLKRVLAGISGTVLSERLKELERVGLVVKKTGGGRRSAGVKYRLSDCAKELEAIMEEIGSWQARWKPLV